MAFIARLSLATEKRIDAGYILNNPSGGNEVCWEVLKDINKSRLDLVSVDQHDGPRPDRLTVVFNAKSVNFSKVERWWPCKGAVCYRPIDALYEMARSNWSHTIQEPGNG